MRLMNDSTSIRSRFIRVAGEHRTAAEVLRTASLREDFPIVISPTTVEPLDDYAQIDLGLAALYRDDHAIDVPHSGLSYAGFNPEQRGWFLDWLENPTVPAPPAFQQLYLAHMEVSLFEERLAKVTLESLLTLNATPVWQDHPGISRSILLGLWLLQDAEQLHDWIASGNVHQAQLGQAVGHLALLHEDMSPGVASMLLAQWGLSGNVPNLDILALRLSSLTETLGAPPLQYIVTELGDEAKEPKPWRCHHRDLRVALPQPDLRKMLETHLRDLVDIDDVETSHSECNSVDDGAESDKKVGQAQSGLEDVPWSLVLEFGESRSEYFPYALTLAKQRPDFTQLMDEDRKIVYRVVFRKREMRHFWRLWEYVTNWSGTNVYVNGRHVEKYHIWPYSQHLR